ncbi:hypothetical protein B0T17DRAFT_503336 [Bombardia bombarda]|uniref:Uncharacterized protein n=1 Tax=Bombardia bombarda TaxID=252184 RepID=A0AA39XMR4_9PEZI|nr:hypothetical protein B0T17DRAFT_503336 [Bombardia bombarda]
MQLIPTTLATVLVTIGAANAAAISSRIPLMGIFRASATALCPLGPSDLYQIGLGAEDDSCRRFYNNVTYGAVDVQYWNSLCLFTIFNTLDCSDPGIVSGLGCWSPEGGLVAYKATCPYRN